LKVLGKKVFKSKSCCFFNSDSRNCHTFF